MIRCLGGQVSWDNTAAPGSTFNVEDTTVTHQICDRPRDSVDMKHIERFYIQPQWVSVLSVSFSFFVFREKGPGTCTRARELLPLVTALLGSIDPSLCVLLCPLN